VSLETGVLEQVSKTSWLAGGLRTIFDLAQFSLRQASYDRQLLMAVAFRQPRTAKALAKRK
jgi:hypothetical protein